MAYKVRLPKNKENLTGLTGLESESTASLPLLKNTGESGETGEGDPTEGRIIAVEISSTILQADIWLTFDDAFDPQYGKAVFYVDELEFLKTKTPEQLREIYKVKLASGRGSRVRQ